MNGNRLDPSQIEYLMTLLRGRQPQQQQMDNNMLLNLLQQDPYNQRTQLAFNNPFKPRVPQITPGTEIATPGIRG